MLKSLQLQDSVHFGGLLHSISHFPGQQRWGSVPAESCADCSVHGVQVEVGCLEEVLSRMAADQDGTWGSVMFIPKGDAHETLTPVSLHFPKICCYLS